MIKKPSKLRAFFRPNGCTFSPDFNFRSCCDEHDKDYFIKRLTRKEADIKLYNCIRLKHGKTTAKIYYFFVRCFGGFFF